MARPPTPLAEAARLRALRSYEVLDTPAEEAFDGLTRLAAQICGTPISLVSLVDAERQWFKSRLGFAQSQTPRDVSFCAHAIAQPGTLVVPDTCEDARFADNPLVTGDPRLRFYAGAPLRTPDGHALGTLCVLDTRPRQLSAEQLEALALLARQAQLLLELRRRMAELRASREALRESEERYRDLFEGASDLIQAVAPDGRLLYANRAWCEALGYAEEEAASLRLLDVIHPDHRGETLDLFQWVLEGGQVETAEFIFVAKDGRRIVAEGSVTCRRQEGRPLGTRAILRDVTQRRKAEEALRASEARTRSILDNMLGGLITVSPSGVVESVNPAALRIFGYSEDELLGRSLAQLMPPSDDPEAFLRDVLQSALGRVSEWQGRRRGGQPFPFELSLFEVQTPEGRFYAGSIQDVSERREVERLKKEFVSTVSHELRTPLTSIRGSLSLLAGGVLGELPDEAKDVLAIAERNVVRLIGLINDILDLERLETGRIEMRMADVPIEEVFARSLEAVRAAAEQQRIRLDVKPCDAVARGDGDRLVQVVVNLLGNAAKFSPPGAPVTLEASEHGDVVEVRVIDRGRGVPKQAQQAIFERFKQVEASDQREKGGTGLGLAICRTIVEQHHGSIGVISEEGRGSIFWFRVPSARARDPFLASLQESGTPPAEGPPADVVLVDRDEAMLGVMARQLLREGLAVRTARSGGAALELLEERVPALLVLDLDVSGPDGFGVVEALRARPALASLPVLVYTERDVSTAERERLGAGPLVYLTKSRASEEEFRRRIMELLAPAGGLGGAA